MARVHLDLGEHAVLRDERLVGRVQQRRDRLGRRAQVRQAPARGLGGPVGGVAVAVEDHALVLAEDAAQERLERLLEALRAGGLELLGEAVEGVRHHDVEEHVRGGAGLRGAGLAELELVAGEGEGRGAVAVRRVARQRRERIDADAQRAGLARGAGGAVGEARDDVAELLAEEDG